MKPETHLGWPIVTAKNCFEIIRNLGIKSWPKLTTPVPLNEWLQTASVEQKSDYEGFAPKSSVIKHRNPYDGTTFNAFRVEFKPYSLVFALIENRYVAVTAEWKHGNDKITIVPVCGIAGKDEAGLPTLAEKMEATAFREWHEETGLTLEKVIPLSPSSGMFYSVRNSDSRCFPYLGIVKPGELKRESKFDHTEHLVMVLFTLDEWMRLLEDHSLFDENQDFGLEDCTRAATYAALRHLGILRLSITS